MKNFDIPKFLVISTTLMVAVMLGLGYFFTPPSENVQSQVIIAWVGIVGYYFHSSASSAKKTDLLARKEGTPE